MYYNYKLYNYHTAGQFIFIYAWLQIWLRKLKLENIDDFENIDISLPSQGGDVKTINFTGWELLWKSSACGE